jgi:hypothetical protein
VFSSQDDVLTVSADDEPESFFGGGVAVELAVLSAALFSSGVGFDDPAAVDPPLP